MVKIEYLECEEYPDRTGWYINEYDKLDAAPIEVTGPYDTKTAALRMWRDQRPPVKEPSDAGES